MSAVALSFGPAFWRQVMSAEAVSGSGPYGALSTTPDENGLLLPAGFTSRVVARGGQPVGSTGFVRPIFPDGSATFATPSGGWILVTNSENPPPESRNTFPGQKFGGASAIEFDAAGEIVDAYWVLQGTRSNCAGGPTPWGTYLSCEEYDAAPGERGLVWECDPKRPGPETPPAVARPVLGGFMHEAATVDPVNGHVYLTEDQKDGLFYRFIPTGPKRDLSAGRLQAAKVDAARGVEWLPVPDPAGTLLPTRQQVPDATTFNGGEGCFIDGNVVYVSTKGDDRIWKYDIAAATMTVAYDAAGSSLRGVDNLAVSSRSGDVLVAEDGGDMEVVIITPEGDVAPLLRMTGIQQGTAGVIDGGQPDTDPLPHAASEVSGLAFSPDGTRLYANSQRGYLFGVTYEVTGPFRTTR